VTRYLEFKSVAGSFVVREGKIYKVPATATEAMTSSLLGFFDKTRFRNFLEYVNEWEPTDPATWKDIDVNKMSSADFLAHFGLAGYNITFVGHTLGLFLDDTYLVRPARELVDRVKLFAYSLARYGSSPFIFPLYGNSGIAESFSRMCAVNGGVYMLSTPPEEILYDEAGKVRGVRTAQGVATCKKLVADPSYFIGTNKVKKIGEVAHSICILNHTVPNTSDADSCQIIIPASEAGAERKSDIYVSVVSSNHCVAPKGRCIAHVSATVESNKPHDELIPALKLLGAIDKEFFWVSEQYAPVGDGSDDNIIISQSLDGTSHFETSTVDIESMYKRITGNPLELTISPNLETE
jgi:Rab GDP dissociation inhibitor